MSGTIVMLAKGGRVRLLRHYDQSTDEWYHIATGAPGTLACYAESNSSSTVVEMVNRLEQIYGVVDFIPDALSTSNTKITTLGKTYTSDDVVGTSGGGSFPELGFLEGVAKIQTDAGIIHAIVKNGVLYPMISQYNENIGDNESYTAIRLKDTQDIADLQTMLDNSERYFAYKDASLADPWSPIENILHQKVEMEVVAKVASELEESQTIGIYLPGLSYQITL